jgi:hypothetical protein
LFSFSSLSYCFQQKSEFGEASVIFGQDFNVTIFLRLSEGKVLAKIDSVLRSTQSSCTYNDEIDLLVRSHHYNSLRIGGEACWVSMN